jgi:hypothetical protein
VVEEEARGIRIHFPLLSSLLTVEGMRGGIEMKTINKTVTKRHGYVSKQINEILKLIEVLNIHSEPFAIINVYSSWCMSRDRIVGMATGYGLTTEGSEFESR